MRAEPEDALRTLLGVATMGGGVAFIVGGVSVLRDSGTLRGVALIGLGAAFIGGGVAFLRKTTLMGLIRASTHEPNAEERERLTRCEGQPGGQDDRGCVDRLKHRR